MRIAGKSPVVFSRRYIDSFMVGFFIVMLVFCLGCTSCWVTNYIPKARFEKCSNLITLPEKKRPMFSRHTTITPITDSVLLMIWNHLA